MDGSSVTLGLALDAASLERLADLVAERLAARTTPTQPGSDGWLDSGGAATYLAVHPSTIRRLAASGDLRSTQDASGGPRYFQREDLDRWRNSRK